MSLGNEGFPTNSRERQEIDKASSPEVSSPLEVLRKENSVSVESGLPMTEEKLLSQGYEMYPPGGIELNGSKSRKWNTESPCSDQEILNLLERENIKCAIIMSNNRKYLYIKYPETPTPDTQVEYEI